MANLDLIDWRTVAFGSLSILGLALILSILGFADYHAARAGRSFKEEIRLATYPLAIDLGLALFCLGMIGSSAAGWEATFWAILSAIFAAHAAYAWRRRLPNSD